ncbi:flagellar hook protein FlgE [Legionella fairfieldensis]|uniref:flagellar hook protein FlgE n=1 Tax=Legionella fairfieldensis TaxID=45064 RepID=UPI0004913858|nr:flagellar hook protein FlgE [Legionella fairfieldensis]
MSFGTGLSGLQAASSDLNVVGNNIANSATTGFKSSRALFADVYANSFSGSGNAIGSGVNMISVQQSFAQGDISFTNNSLDLAINGAGFFVVNNNGSPAYTRAGAFNIDNNGFVVNSLGQRLTGLLADANGTISTVSGDLQINTANIVPRATTAITTGTNLYANSTPPSIAWNGGATPATTSYNNVTSSTIYDSLGNSHVLSMYFIRADATATAGDPNASSPINTTNQWYVAFQVDNQNVPANAGATNSDNLFRVNFNADGTFSTVADVTNTPLPANLIPLSINLNNGSNPLNFTVDLSNSTQFGSPFAVQSTSQNGFTTGVLNGFQVDASGILSGRYSNGQTLNMGQIQLANFGNVNGLQPVGNTSWTETFASGQAILGTPGNSSLGALQAGALENSNVNLTGELVDLISAQRNFQANAQTIRAEDTITQTIINLS